MRIGENPNRRAQAQGYKPFVASAVTHLPNFEGYHEKRFEVVNPEALYGYTEEEMQILLDETGG